MTESEQERIMRDIFGVMLVRGTLRNQSQMARELKAIHYLLGSMEGLSAQECDNCLLYFFREYAQGCRETIDDDYIIKNIIPNVKNFNGIDIVGGASILLAAKNYGVK